jgi:hypothetical protein
VEALIHLIDLLKHWLAEVDTDPDFRDCMVEYARGIGGITMMEICRGMDHKYCKVAKEQDAIGWRHFMEGMICLGLRSLQEMYTTVDGLNIIGDQWVKGVIIKLLEMTHGQWLYRCVQVHNRVSRTQATQRKDELQLAIKAQQDIEGRICWKRINI